MQIRHGVCRSLAYALCKEYVIYTTKVWRLRKEKTDTTTAFWTARQREITESESDKWKTEQEIERKIF